uniref:Uncharacterized protein n=1 Tax=Physcomitrium patens TaxID=3218 RepID=A0A2K1JP71_PHYPA|nr:hypothetical protein PHYPA_015729 [Physcomitrium patens]
MRRAAAASRVCQCSASLSVVAGSARRPSILAIRRRRVCVSQRSVVHVVLRQAVRVGLRQTDRVHCTDIRNSCVSDY